MNPAIPLHRITDREREQVGGKGFALAVMAQNAMNVPDAICVSTQAYDDYVVATGLRERILLELSRKEFKKMRWEEMWDAALRIRNMFLNAPIPEEISTPLRHAVDTAFSGKAVVVRSSAPGEDSAKASFAGLHESYVNVQGTEAILDHVRLVWASLWSDAALLYRQELGLDVERSTMAVVVQEIVVGEQSGVAFGMNPNDQSQAVIEAVYGLNQGLVEGTVEPDRWILDRKTGKQLAHVAVPRNKAILPSSEGVQLAPLPPTKVGIPPLNGEMIESVFNLIVAAERLFNGPQDVEWTFKKDILYVIQSRPITTQSASGSPDQRSWYLSLRRSAENLKSLRRRIEEQLIPQMIDEATRLADKDLTTLTDTELGKEIERRSAIHAKWVDVYWTDFIPFAHGARLFAQVYNDAVCPSDPYEFMDLLGATKMASLERNRILEDLASMVRHDPQLARNLENHEEIRNDHFRRVLNDFVDRFGDQFRGTTQSVHQRDPIFKLVLEMARRPPRREQFQPKDIEALTNSFLSRFDGKQRTEVAELLDLGRASYRLRDDDNVYLGRIESQMLAAIVEGKHRISKRILAGVDRIDAGELVKGLQDPDYVPKESSVREETEAEYQIKARQLVGQPAGPGIAKGMARVILDPSDLFDFKAGEILVCDAIDPNMTFVVPLSAGIVERRGGMLIHGAIIAREYGLPCVTGVPDAPSMIRTGDEITVDGYLGIVIVG